MPEEKSITSLLAAYDELVMLGAAPPPEEFAAAHPQHPALLARLTELAGLRHELDAALAAPAMTGRPPLIPGFLLHRPLGAGGMGVVWAAEQLSPRRLCAVKVMAMPSPQLRQRMRREADLAARLSHPAIAAVFAFGESESSPYLATEFVHGFSLRALLAAADVVPAGAGHDWLAEALRRLSEDRATRQDPEALAPVALMHALGLDLAEALAHAHQRGVIHRDVKPSNVMVTFDGRAKLIDFGLAMTVEDDGGHLTSTGGFVGSIPYAAPEQLRGAHEDVGPWTDTFAAGATLFEMLTQRTPFAGHGLAERLQSAAAPPAFGPRHFNAAVPHALDAVVMKALHPDPRQRFADGDALLVALQRAQHELPVLAYLGLARLGARWSGLRSRAPLYLALGAAAAFAWLYRGERLEHDHSRLAFLEQRRATAHAVLADVVARQRPALLRCVPYRPVGSERPRFTADLGVRGGVVTSVTPGPARFITAAAQRCLLATLKQLALPGVGDGDGESVHLELELSDGEPSP